MAVHRMTQDMGSARFNLTNVPTGLLKTPAAGKLAVGQAYIRLEALQKLEGTST
jgi:hypothetical protein